MLNHQPKRGYWGVVLAFVILIFGVFVFVRSRWGGVCLSVEGYTSDKIVRDLRSEEDRDFVRAISYLTAHPDERNDAIVAALIDIVREPPSPRSLKARNRQGAVLAYLSTVKEKAAVPMLIERLGEDPGDDGIASALGAIGDERAVEQLVAIFDKRGPTGNCVHIALGKIGGERAVRFLAGRLGKEPENPDLILALGETRDKRALEPLLLSWPKYKESRTGKAYLQSIAKVADERALPLLVGESMSPDAWRRSRAAEGLGRTHSKQGLDRLREMLVQEKDQQVRYSVTIGLGIHGSEEAVKLLAGQLNTVTRDAVEAMRNGKPLGREWEDIYCIGQALAATRRASALVALVKLVEGMQELGAQQYVNVNRQNAVNAETCMMMTFEAIAVLRGTRNVVNPYDMHFMHTQDAAATLQRTVDCHLAWWRKEGQAIRALAAAEKVLPSAEQPKDPYLDSR